MGLTLDPVQMCTGFYVLSLYAVQFACAHFKSWKVTYVLQYVKILNSFQRAIRRNCTDLITY